jgi:hypothetical protein
MNKKTGTIPYGEIKKNGVGPSPGFSKECACGFDSKLVAP